MQPLADILEFRSFIYKNKSCSIKHAVATMPNEVALNKASIIKHSLIDKEKKDNWFFL